MNRKILSILGLIVLLGGVFPNDALQPQALQAQTQIQSQSSKITGLLASQVAAKLEASNLGGVSAAIEHAAANGKASILEAPSLQVKAIDRQRIFLYFKQEPSAVQKAELTALGVILYTDTWMPPIGAHPAGFLLAEIPVEGLNTIAQKNYVFQLDSAERAKEALNDQATQAANITAFRTSSGLTGAGVKIAILDSGLDLTHPDIPTPVGLKDYSNYPISTDNDIANQVTGHGTHVTGSALGRGSASAGVYAGAAPGADLVFLKVGNDTTGAASDPAIIKAIQDAVNVYHVDIISLSYGGWSDYHDGTDALSQTVDWAFNQGVLVFVAAGNEANNREHYTGNSTLIDYQFMVDNGSAGATALAFNLVWYDNSSLDINYWLEYYDSNHNLLASTSLTQGQSPRGTKGQYSHANVRVSNGYYYLRVKTNLQSAMPFHLYYDPSYNIAGAGTVSFQNVDVNYTLSSPAEADCAIAVGAYTTRDTWWNYENDAYYYPDETLNELATYSSRGPRVDYQGGAPMKPNLVAPGGAIISARDSNVYTTPGGGWIDNNGPNVDDPLKNNGNPATANYYISQGTSMATPIVAGAAALILQAHPNWTAAQVKSYLEANAIDMGSVPGHDHEYGVGRLYLPLTLNTPEIDLIGNGFRIIDGDNTPSWFDHTDFGTVATNGGVQIRTFTIFNPSSVDLVLNGAVSVVVDNEIAEFEVVSQPSSPVPPGGTVTFQVRFNPAVAGVRAASVIISCNDANENPFNFIVQGTGVGPYMYVTSPNGGENWHIGLWHIFQWQTSGFTGNVKVELSRDHGATWSTIMPNTPNDGSETWMVTGAAAPQALARISSISNPEVVDISNAFFTILQPSISVSAPNGGEDWAIGSSQNITWQSQNQEGDVNIEASHDGGLTWSPVVANTQNDGEYAWTVTGPPTTQGRLRVCSALYLDTSDISDANFIIRGSPVLILTSPNGGENWKSGTTHTITWDSLDIQGNIKIELSRDFGTTWTTIVSNTANDGSYGWNITGTNTARAKIRVSSVADSSLKDVSAFDFSILPSITVTSPSTTGNWVLGSTRNITWTSAGTSGDVKIEISYDAGNTWNIIAANTQDDGSYTWTVAGEVGALARIKVSTLDASADEVFVVGGTWGTDGVALHYDGTSWTTMDSGTEHHLMSVWGSSPMDVFAVGASGTIIYFNGSTWSAMNSGTNADLLSVWGNSPTDVFASGGNPSGIDGIILHYDGNVWSTMVSGIAAGPRGVWGSSANNVFAVGYFNAVRHYNGTAWTTTFVEPASNMWDIWGISPTNLFVVGPSGINHYDGGTWSPMSAPDTNLYGVWGGSYSDVFAVGGDQGLVLHFDGTTWRYMSDNTSEHLNSVWGSTTSNVFAVSQNGSIIHFDGAAWSAMSSGSTDVLHDVWGFGGLSPAASAISDSDVTIVSGLELTVTGVTASNKVYDGDTDADINTSSATLAGVQPGDTVSLVVDDVEGEFDTKSVGNGKPVTISGLAITGPDAAKYTLTQPTATANVTPKPLAVTATGVNKVYDGTNNATVNVADNRVSGDVLSATASATFNNKNVGTGKTVTVTGISLSGADSGNYTANTSTTATANITAKPLTFTGITAVNKVYTGTTSATLSGTAALQAAEAPGTGTASDGKPFTGDIMSLVGTASGTFNNKNAGNGKTVTVSGLTINGADAGNYTLTQPTATANITPRAITVTAVADTRTYNGTTASSGLPAIAPALVSGDTSGFIQTFDNKNIGTAKTLTPSGTAADGNGGANYAVTFTTVATGEITKATVTPIITISNKVYDRTTAATILTRTLGGVFGSDAVTLNGGTAAFANAAAANGKTVNITGLNLGGAGASNYQLSATVASAMANITPKPLTVTGIIAAGKIYDGNTGATINSSAAALSGVITGDAITLDITGTAGAFNNKTAGPGKTVAVSGLSIGGAEVGNYSLIQPTTTAAITPKELTVGGTFTANNRTYNGTTTAAINNNSLTLTGKVNGDTVNLSPVATFADAMVGNNKTVSLTATSTITGADAPNYSLSLAGAPTTTANITKATVTPTVTIANKPYDGTTAAIIQTRALSTVFGSDDVTLTGGTAAFNTTGAGNGKTVNVTGLALSGNAIANYQLSATTATASANITRKTLGLAGITINGKIYDRTTTATFSGIPSLSGLIGTETLTANFSVMTLEFADNHAGAEKVVAVAGITLADGASGGLAANYAVAPSFTSTAAITPKALTVGGSFTINSRTYNGTTAAAINNNSLTLTGKVNGDTVNLSAVATFADAIVGNGKTISLAAASSLAGADAANYVLTLTGAPTATANITRATVTPSVDVSPKVYDGTTSAGIQTRSLTGVFGSDDVSLSGGAATFATPSAGPGKPVNVTGLTISGTGIGNYQLSAATATASADITPKVITPTVTVASKVFDGSTAATILSLALTGVIGTDAVTLSGGTANFDTAAAGNGKTVTVTGLTLSGTDAGNYTLSSTTATTTASITSQQTSSGGGSGGGGGFGNQLVGINLAGTSPWMDGNGRAITAGLIHTSDNTLSLAIPTGTAVWNKAGAAQGFLSANVLADPPQPPAQHALVLAYEMGPSGVTFTPAATLTMAYAEDRLPPGTVEADLYITWWNGIEWVKLETTVDAAANTASAQVNHFTSFALMAQPAPPPATTAPPPTQPQATVTPTTTPPPLATTTAPPVTTVEHPSTPPPSDGRSNASSMLPVIGIGLLLAMAFGVMMLRSRKK